MSWKIRAKMVEKYRLMHSSVWSDPEAFDKFLLKYIDQVTFGDMPFDLVNFAHQDLFFAIPSPEVMVRLTETFETHLLIHPTGRFIELAAGTGVFSWLLYRTNKFKKDQLIAVDKHVPKKAFWEITIDPNFRPHPTDILFIAWGHPTASQDLQRIIDQYVDDGGRCLIVQEDSRAGDEITYPDPRVYEDNEKWDVSVYDIPSSLIGSKDLLTINHLKD